LYDVFRFQIVLLSLGRYDLNGYWLRYWWCNRDEEVNMCIL